MTTSVLSKLLPVFPVTSIIFSAFTTLGLVGIRPQQVNAQGCELSSKSYRLIPARTDGPFVRTDGKVYKGEYQGSEITLCNGIKIKPKPGCDEAYQWTSGNYKYQIHLICSYVGNGNDFEAKLLIKQRGKVILDENLYMKGKAG